MIYTLMTKSIGTALNITSLNSSENMMIRMSMMSMNAPQNKKNPFTQLWRMSFKNYSLADSNSTTKQILSRLIKKLPIVTLGKIKIKIKIKIHKAKKEK